MRDTRLRPRPLGCDGLPKVSAFALLLAAMAFGLSPGFSAGAPAQVGLKPHLAIALEASESPAEWVAAGGGLLLFGKGASLTVAKEGSPAPALARMTLEGRITEGVVFGRYAYLAEDSQGLRVLDLADPSAPAEVGLIPLQRAAIHLAQLGDDLLVAQSGHGLKVLETCPGKLCDLVMANGTRMDMGADPMNPRESGFLPASDPISSISADGNVAYLAEPGRGIAVVDLSNPQRPNETRLLPGGAEISAMVVTGGVLLAADGTRELTAERLQESAERAALPLRVSSLSCAGRLVYAAAGDRGLVVLEAGPSAEGTFNVNVGNVFFQPSSLHVFPGDTVQWTWIGGTHSTTSGTCSGGAYGSCNPDGTWDSGVRSGGTFSYTFPKVGGQPYYCSVHLASMTGKITVDAPAVLSATASASVTTGRAPLAVAFTGGATGGTPPFSFGWTFGDGQSSSEQNPTHTYGTLGNYSAVLAVMDGVGATATAPAIAIGVTGGTAGLTASATSSATSGAVPLTVSFNASASGGAPPYSFLWDFGDGSGEASQDPSHAYASPGVFHVTLTVTDSASSQVTDSHLVITATSAAGPQVASMGKLGAPFRILVSGSNFEQGIQVQINGTPWGEVKLKSATSLVIKGGASLKAVVPKSTDVLFTFVNPDGGQATFTFKWT